MLSLQRSLLDQDIGHLRVIAECWGIELPKGSARQVAAYLVQRMLEPELLDEILEGLPEPAARALHQLVEEHGRIPWQDAIRRFGALREMGPGRRDRIKPWREPISALEILWYRALVSRAFLESPSGLQEFLFIPDDILTHLTPGESQSDAAPGSACDPPLFQIQARNTAGNDAATLLAALRLEPSPSWPLSITQQRAIEPFLLQPEARDLILLLLADQGILSSEPLQPSAERVRQFLDLDHGLAGQKLLSAWSKSKRWNDLEQTPGLHYAGDRWPNDPLLSRQSILKHLASVPLGEWWDLDAFVGAIHAQDPSFQRPAGDFDSWYVQDRETGEFLRGYAFWDRVEGALLRFILTGPLFWLGGVNLGAESPDQPVHAFQLTAQAGTLLHGMQVAHAHADEPKQHVEVLPDGRINAPFGTALAVRYQIARFAAWQSVDAAGYTYLLTPGSLEKAKTQGLEPRHIEAILSGAADAPIPPRILGALSRWANAGREGYFEELLVLQVRDAELLQWLRSERSTARYLAEELGPNTCTVKHANWPALRAAAARLGVLLDPPK